MGASPDTQRASRELTQNIVDSPYRWQGNYEVGVNVIVKGAFTASNGSRKWPWACVSTGKVS